MVPRSRRVFCVVLLAAASGAGSSSDPQPVGVAGGTALCLDISRHIVCPAMQIRGGGEGGGESRRLEVGDAGPGSGAQGTQGGRRAVEPRATRAGVDLLATVRIGSSIINSSTLAWSWGAPAAHNDGARPHSAQEQPPVGGGKPPPRAAGGTRGSQGRASFTEDPARPPPPLSAGRRQTWTQTQVIQGRGMPGHQEFTGRTLFLGGTGDLVEKDLWEYLALQFGDVADVEVIRHYDAPRGYAFVTFADSSAATQCIVAGSFLFKGHTVNVSPSDREGHAPRYKRVGKFARKVDVPACSKIFLGGTRQLTEGTLLPMLERFGEVTSLHVMSRPENMLQCAGFAFATYASSEEAQRIVNKGFITVANVTMEARFADDNLRPGVSEKVSLLEAEDLVEALKEEVQRVVEHAPGGYKQHPPVVHEGIVFAPGVCV